MVQKDKENHNEFEADLTITQSFNEQELNNVSKKPSRFNMEGALDEPLLLESSLRLSKQIA